MRQAGRRETMHSAGHRFTAGLWMASQPRGAHLGRMTGRQHHLGKAIEGQNEDRITPRLNTDQCSPPKGYDSRWVIVLIWLDALLSRVDCRWMSTRWLNGFRVLSFFALKRKNRTGPYLVFRHVSQLPVLCNQDSQNPCLSPLSVQHKQALVEGRAPGLGNESSFSCWIHSILYTASLPLISSYKW